MAFPESKYIWIYIEPAKYIPVFVSKVLGLSKIFGHLSCFCCIIAMVYQIPQLWKSSGGRLDGKPEVGQYGTVHVLQGDQYGTVHALQEGQYGSIHALQKGQYGIFAPSFTPNFSHNFTLNFTSVFTPSFNPNITTNLSHHDKDNVICVWYIVFFSAAKQLADSSQPIEPAEKDRHFRMFAPGVNPTKRYGPLRGPSSSSCGGLRPLAEAFFARRAYYTVLAHFWHFLVSRNNLGNFQQ